MNDFYNLATLLCTFVGGMFGLGIWINGQFTSQRREFMSQLQYHEKHDDQRFAELNDAIWELLKLQSRGYVDQKDSGSRTRRTKINS